MTKPTQAAKTTPPPTDPLPTPDEEAVTIPVSKELVNEYQPDQAYHPDLPPVAVLILTYDRPEELRATVWALRDNLLYPPEKLHVYIADDASPSGVGPKMFRDDDAFKDIHWILNSENRGWGATVNQALTQIMNDGFDLVYFTEDDYVLRVPLLLPLGVALMVAKPNIGMLRYRGTGGDNMVYHGSEADISALAPFPEWREAPGSYVPGRLSYLQLGNGSPSPYLYSNGPHLRRASFAQFYGPYDEGRTLGATEEAMAVRVKTMMTAAPIDAPAIAILPEFVAMQYEHIGTSYQLTNADKGAGPGIDPAQAL